MTPPCITKKGKKNMENNLPINEQRDDIDAGPKDTSIHVNLNSVSGYGKNAHYFIVRTLTKLVGIDINTDGTRCHRVTYVLEQARFIVSHEGRNLPILITS